MRDLQTMQKMNDDAERREYESRGRDFIRFTHLEVEEMLDYLKLIQNPSSTMRGTIRKLYIIHDLQVEAHKRSLARLGVTS